MRVPNLASRVLSLNLKRLSQDWQAVHGHPIDLRRPRVLYRGACYRAANWEVVGITRGFGKTNACYWRHDAPKEVLLDGKMLCRARRGRTGAPVHLLSALLQGSGATLAQHEVPQKTHEIPEIKTLLKPLALQGRVITADPCLPKRIRRVTSSRRKVRITCSR